MDLFEIYQWLSKIVLKQQHGLSKQDGTVEAHYDSYLIPEVFLLNHVQTAISDPKSLRPLKNLKSGSYLGLGLSIYVKKGIEISLDCPVSTYLVSYKIMVYLNLHWQNSWWIHLGSIGHIFKGFNIASSCNRSDYTV